MAIKIQTKNTVIPIEIGELEFSFDATDENVKKFRKSYLSMKNEFIELQEKLKKDEDEELADAESKGIIKRAFDSNLGEGAFEKIFNITPSLYALTGYYIELTNCLFEELAELTQVKKKAKTAKYLKK
jgi:hypothetical protein|nr:hypothetical protein [Carnobacterium maltaromaticum]